MEKKMNNKGFSLVELIVVIAIMAVLVGVLAPQFIKYVEKSRESTDITNLDSIKTVVESYFADKEADRLPDTVEIKIDNNTNKVYVLDIKKGGSTMTGVTSDDVLGQGGVKGTKLKGAQWTKTGNTAPTAKWDLTTNKWEYNAKSDYYTTDNTTKQIIPE